MRPVLLDTNAYASFKRNEDPVVAIIRHMETIAISPIVIGELLAGFENGNKTKQNKSELQQFLESARVIVYPITLDTGHYFSQVYSALRVKGKSIPTNDMWIAAQALEHGCMVCTHDNHFSFIDGIISGSTPEQLFI